MEFWSRLVGGQYAPKRPAPRSPADDPEARLGRFRRAFSHVVEICNRPRNIAAERDLLGQLQSSLLRLVELIRQETRAPLPHLCLQFAASNQIYTAIGKGATVSQYEPVIHAAVSLFAALVDSEEEDFLANAAFAKSLMRLVTKAIDSGDVLVGMETETAVLELLFTISAKIRLQPAILSVWFHSSAKPGVEDIFLQEKRAFVGTTQKNDFPLCYLLIDRVHHEGRIGDFARTGLLYIFEATGRSLDLEEWVLSSDLPTLMASGLGALYSQLSRELSILHPDATLPPVLAMSDYSTTQSRADAESAFSERHRAHMATFLSYLAFWQDVLDHCRSADVKQTLLDHFQILFLQQLLYPSILQSSDTDAGSSVAVLTYMTAILEALEFPELLHTMLTYLLAIPEPSESIPSAPTTPVRPTMAPRSPTTVRRRESLMLLTAPKDPETAVEPTVFNLVDLVLNSITSSNTQTSYAALKLLSTMMTRQKKYAFSTLLKVRHIHHKQRDPERTTGTLELELEKYTELADSLFTTSTDDKAASEAYASLCDDVRLVIEAQAPSTNMTQSAGDGVEVNNLMIPTEDLLLKSLTALLRTFFTNSVDVNLALTAAIVSIATCVEIRLDGWLGLDAGSYVLEDAPSSATRSWQTHLDGEERDSWFALQHTRRRPAWSEEKAPLIFTGLQAVALELNHVRDKVTNLSQLLAARKMMLQGTSIDAVSIASEVPTLEGGSTQAPTLPEAPKTSRGHSRGSSVSSATSSRGKATSKTASPHSRSRSLAAPPTPVQFKGTERSSPLSAQSIYQPPPPETPSTTDVLMQKITFAAVRGNIEDAAVGAAAERAASLNHVLTNIAILQDFVLELIAVIQVRASVLGDKEVRCR